MLKKHALPKIIFSLILLFEFQLVFAAIPPTLNYQGQLTDSSGVPVDGPVSMVFAIYDVDDGGTPLWSDSLSVTVNQGIFSIELGAGAAPFPSGLFENPLWIGLAIATDKEMSPRRAISSTGFSFKSGDADTLEGVRVSTLDQSAHVTDTANPHSVTAAQTGAADAATLSTHIGNTGNPHSVTAAQTGATSSASFTLHTGDADAHHSKTSNYSELIGTVDDIYIDSSITRDSELASHSASQSVHHARYTDGEAVAAIKAADGASSTLDADLLDGLQASEVIDAAQDEVRTPIDSLPFNITASGSYYLVGNLSDNFGISVQADDVSIDLMGYTISGTGSDGYGIYIGNQHNVEIRNGTVRGFGYAGIFEASTTASAHHIKNVRAIDNGKLGTTTSFSGITLYGSNHRIENCVANANGAYGIYAGSHSIVIGSIATGNAAKGIYAGNSSSISNNVASGNGTDGISTVDHSNITDNTSSSNARYGISGGFALNITKNTVSSNGTQGILAGTGSVITHNTARSNQQWGIYATSACTIMNNNISYNNLANIAGVGGLHLDSDNHVVGNTLNGNVRVGIILFSGDNVLIENHFTDSPTSVSFEASGNYYRDNTSAGSADGFVTVINVSTHNGGGNIEF